VAVGPGKAADDGKAAPLGISTGSTVLYSRYAGSEFTGEDGSEYVVISASDVLATLA
jgi:chaperonin GroES